MGNDIKLPFQHRNETSIRKPEVEMKAKLSLIEAIKSKKAEITNIKHQIAQIDFNIGQINLNKEYYNKIILNTNIRLEVLQNEILNASLALDNYIYQNTNYMQQLQQLEKSEIETDDEETNYCTSDIDHLKMQKNSLTEAIEAKDLEISQKWNELLECQTDSN